MPVCPGRALHRPLLGKASALPCCGFQQDIMQVLLTGMAPAWFCCTHTLTVCWACTRYLMQPVYREYPEVKARHHLVLDRQLVSINESDMGNADMSPSSGWLGALEIKNQHVQPTSRVGSRQSV